MNARVKPIRTATDREATAIHEAGHAVLLIALNLGLKSVTIVPDLDAMEAGSATHGGEWGNPARDFGEEEDDTAQLRSAAEDAFFLRHAIACYAGAEAVRQLRPDRDAGPGADSDFQDAVDYINQIADDPDSIDLYFKLAKRRCTVLVEHYAPEIEALAAALLARETLTGDEAVEVFRESLLGRRGRRLQW
jgi:ATP-dependent Zn protease